MSLRVEEVCEIIRFAAASGVRRLRYESLDVSFAPKPAAILDEEAPQPSSESPTKRQGVRQTRRVAPTEQELAVARERLAALAAAEEAAKVQEQVDARELHVADLAISDPLAFERLMNGETSEHFEEG